MSRAVCLSDSISKALSSCSAVCSTRSGQKVYRHLRRIQHKYLSNLWWFRCYCSYKIKVKMTNQECLKFVYHAPVVANLCFLVKASNILSVHTSSRLGLCSIVNWSRALKRKKEKNPNMKTFKYFLTT